MTKAPTPGRTPWLIEIVKKGGYLAHNSSFKSSWEGKLDIEKEYYIFEAGGKLTDFVVHVHWKTIGERMYMVASHFKWRSNPKGEKSATVTRQDLEDVRLPLEGNETFAAP